MTFFSHLLNNFPLSTKNYHLQLHSGQIVLFLLKSHHFQTYFLYKLYKINYNNISRSVHDPPTTLPKKTGGCDPHPRIEAYAQK